MQSLAELAPLAAFFATWAFTDLYIATAVLMGGMALLLVWDWLTTRKIPSMHLVSAALVWVFGTATLLLHDVRFIQWKATVFYWLVALVFIGSLFIGRATVLERVMASVLPAEHKIAPGTWRRATLITALFYLVLGGVNVWVIYTMSEKAWVFFKAWIVVPLVFAFTAGLLFWLLRGYDPKESPPKDPS